MSYSRWEAHKKMLKTTLALLRKANACSGGLETLTASLGPKWADDKEISLTRILKSNGLDHAIWAMRATTEPCKREIVLLSVDFAMEALKVFESYFPDDKRPREALQAASDFMDGKITLAQLENKRSAAYSAARSAARSAAYSADSAAYSAYSAADSAADSARSAADSARSAAYSARSADSARSAAIEHQKKLFVKRVSK
jgi:hypothetical protein